MFVKQQVLVGIIIIHRSNTVGIIPDKENDYITAGDRIKELIDEHGSIPATIYVSDREELQSYIMWWCMTSGIPFKRHPSRTYCEGTKE
jgi:hypothetical protein|tara:strand:- start:26 stop:292 length:267 start_codon:yes stop_codon:yes gene_type:complete